MPSTCQCFRIEAGPTGFAALHAGAPFGYGDWLGVLAWAALGNVVGGVALVTILRLIQVGRDTLQEEREEGD